MEKFWKMMFDEESITKVVDEGKMFRPWEKSGCGVEFYLPSTISTPATENWARMAGQAYLSCVMKQVPLPSKLDPVLLRSMLSIKFDLNVVFGYNPLAGTIALFLKEYSTEVVDASGLVNLDRVPFLLDWLENYEAKKERTLEQFRQCTPLELSEEVVKFALSGCRMVHLCKFRQAFQDIDLHKRLAFFHMWGYLEAVNFNIVSTAADVFENFDPKLADGDWFDNLEEKERFVYHKLVDWINAAPPDDLQALMAFITGSAMLPVKDLITIEFSHTRREEPEGRKPTSSTCFNILRLCTTYNDDEEQGILKDFDTAFHYVKMGLA